MKSCFPNTASFVVGGVLPRGCRQLASGGRSVQRWRGRRFLPAACENGRCAVSGWGRRPVAVSASLPASAAVPFLWGTSGNAVHRRGRAASATRSFPSTARPQPTVSNEALQATRPNDDGLSLRDVPSLRSFVYPRRRAGRLSFRR